MSSFFTASVNALWRCSCSCLDRETYILELWLLKFWTSLILISACNANCTYFNYFTGCWVTFNVFSCDVITDLFILFWRSKIRWSGLEISKISYISILCDIYQNIMVFWKYHDIFDILIFLKIWYFHTLSSRGWHF